MSMEKHEFTSLLDGLQQTWDEAPMFSRWDPPEDGAYPWRLLNVIRDKTKEEKGGRPTWRLQGTVEDIQNEEVNGKEWSPFYFTSEWLGFMKEFLVASTGNFPAELKAADDLLEALVGGLFIIEIKAKADKTGAMRRNCSLIRVQELPAAE